VHHDRSRVKLTMVQLPAVNTPQFEVVRSRMPNAPQPVPPIYQPEVIARAVLHVADHPVRELWVGWSTVKGDRRPVARASPDGGRSGREERVRVRKSAWRPRSSLASWDGSLTGANQADTSGASPDVSVHTPLRV